MKFYFLLHRFCNSFYFRWQLVFSYPIINMQCLLKLFYIRIHTRYILFHTFNQIPFKLYYHQVLHLPPLMWENQKKFSTHLLTLCKPLYKKDNSFDPGVIYLLNKIHCLIKPKIKRLPLSLIFKISIQNLILFHFVSPHFIQ